MRQVFDGLMQRRAGNRTLTVARRSCLTVGRSGPTLFKSKTDMEVLYASTGSEGRDDCWRKRSGAGIAGIHERHAGSGSRGSHQSGKTPIRPLPTRALIVSKQYPTGNNARALRRWKFYCSSHCNSECNADVAERYPAALAGNRSFCRVMHSGGMPGRRSAAVAAQLAVTLDLFRRQHVQHRQVVFEMSGAQPGLRQADRLGRSGE